MRDAVNDSMNVQPVPEHWVSHPYPGKYTQAESPREGTGAMTIGRNRHMG